MSQAQTASAAPWDAIGHRERWRTVAILTLLFILSFIDRNILKLLVEPIKADLGATDIQISLLVGLSFSTLYSISCVPFGYAADLFSRRKLIGAAVFCWSSMSMLCGLAGSYWQLFAGRAGLGIGEAALQPSAASLIRDSFPPEQRARAFSIFGIGPLVGSAMAMLAGGFLFSLAEQGHVRAIPIIGALRPWQFALVVPGMVGLLLGMLVLTLREPPRPRLPKGNAPSFGDTFRHMRTNARLYFLVFAAPTIWSLAGSGWTAWMAAGMGRSWGMSPGEIGPMAGTIALVCTPIGMIGFGFLIDHLSKKGRRDAILQVTLAVQALHMIPAMLIFFAPTPQLMWIAYGASMLVTGTFQIAASSIIAELTPSHLIGKTIALFSMAQNFLGLAIGPTIFALVSSGFFVGDRAIVNAMLLCYPLFIAIAMALAYALMIARRGARAAGNPAFA